MLLKKAYSSKVFGGPIFRQEGKLRNPLNKNIYEVRNLFVGYYDLRNVRISGNKYVDIQIIISDPTHSDLAAYENIKAWHSKCIKLRRSKEKFDDFIEFNAINFYLNGFARMIFYTKTLTAAIKAERPDDYKLDPESE